MDKNIKNIILITNGIYDILCGLSIILSFPYLSELHISMFNDKNIINNKVINNLLAYWIFTYGFVRLYSGIYNNYFLGILTYILEIVFFEYEYFINKNIIRYKLNFVTIISLLIIIILLL